jgi:hypothetical protein
MEEGAVWRAVLALALLCLGLLGLSGRASAATRVETLVIGNNRPPLQSEGPEVRELRFADDDAAAFYEFITHTADAGRLLTLMDRDTQALYPALVPLARVPSLSEVKLAVAEISQRLERYKRAGDRSVVFVFFSGHGTLGERGVPELALVDGGITQNVLYDDILTQLPADALHLFVDACHAEAIVRPRDAQAQVANVSVSHANAFLVQSTLARYSRVGAIVAAASDGQAHEWDQLRQGIFTYELLSALRGGADVNRDARLEYSEVYAFLSAANRAIDDPRARLSVVARAPDIDTRLPIVALSEFRKTKLARLTGIPANAGLVHVEDDAGRRLATVHAEPGFVADLLLPANTTLHVKAGNKEGRLRAAAGESVAFRAIPLAPPAARGRGALERAVRRGLFATKFGRGYYSGFIDRTAEFVSVTLPDERDTELGPVSLGVAALPAKRSAQRLAVGVGLSNVIAERLSLSHSLRLAVRPNQRSGPHAELDVFHASAGELSEWRGTASAGWAWLANFRRTSGYLGFGVGGGVIVQATEHHGLLNSFLGTLSPLAGVSTRVTSSFSVWTEAQLLGLIYRRDHRTVLSLGPSAWLGGSIGL